MPDYNSAVSDYHDSLTPPEPIPAYLGAFVDGAFRTTVTSDPSLTYVRYLDETATTAKHRNRINLNTTDQNIPISLYYDEFDQLAILDFEPSQAGAVLEGDPSLGVPAHTQAATTITYTPTTPLTGVNVQAALDEVAGLVSTGALDATIDARLAELLKSGTRLTRLGPAGPIHRQQSPVVRALLRWPYGARR